MSGFRALMICTAPRSGSTLLCRMLSDTGISGRPGSHFFGQSLEDWLESHDLSLSAFPDRRAALEAVWNAGRAAGCCATGFFGLRMQGHSLSFFLAQLALLHPDAPSDAARIETAFGQTLFVHLTRQDKLAQAISYEKATQTGLWHRAPDGAEIERLSPPRAPVYDAAAIDRTLADLSAQDAAWAHWFAAESIAPLRLRYEDLARQPRAALAGILRALDLPEVRARSVRPSVAPLTDGINRDWARRFRADRPAVVQAPPIP